MDPWEFENLVFNGESGRQAQLGQKSFQAHWLWLREQFGLNEAGLADMRRDFFAGDHLNEPLLEQIKRLRQAGYRTGLLSNLADDARQLWSEVYPFIEFFDGVVISCEVGIMKPDPRVYQLAAESLGVRPEEAVFIDDFIENVEGARRAGMQAIHFIDPVLAQRQLTELTGIV
jgi:epoxide hydrolase-like predicted phosphatase